MAASLATAESGGVETGPELRVTERFSCDVAASCQPPADWKRGGQKWSARVRDVSSGGLCLLLKRRFERGAGLAIELPGSDPDSPSILLARVVHVEAESGGKWALGCQFISPLSDEELEALTRSVQKTPPAETASVHVASVADVHFRGTLPDGGVVHRRIRKLNRNGQWPLAPGRTIALRFYGPSGRSTAKVRVDACRPAGRSWVLEATFIEAPPAGFERPR
jgi:hypothetical protein